MKDLFINCCNICETQLNKPLYTSTSEQSLTSLCQLHHGLTQVWYCSNCGHLQSNILENNNEYYSTEYKILINQEDEDQIYETINNEIIYRTDHQLKVLQEKIRLAPNMKVLDYGCAKAGMAKRLKAIIPTLDFHFFDVSDMYATYWGEITTSDKFAINVTPNEWLEAFDLITSYFSFEHIPNPRNSILHVASLLKENGVFYAIVPNVISNIADFLVVDHVNHFTIPSITKLLTDAGFSNISIDDLAHRGALVVSAKKTKEHIFSNEKINLYSLQNQANEIAKYWNNIHTQISKNKNNNPSAIYGSGFYGSFIYSSMKNPETIEFFLDKNPFQQGRFLFNKPIISPESLPNHVKTLYIGLNPKISRKVILEQDYLQRTDLKIVFLDEFDD